MAGDVTDKDLGWEKIQKELVKFKELCVKVGIVEGSGKEKKFVQKTSKSGGKTKVKVDTDIDLALVAMCLEEGTKNIPSRPFIRSWVDNHKEQIDKMLTSAFNRVLSGKWTAEEAMKRIGEFAQAGIKKNIIDGKFEPNSPKTIAKKGSSKPLIDTGTLRNSIRYEVVEK